MKVDAVIYVDDGCTEDNLMFRGAFVPDEMWKRLSSVRALNEIVFAIPHGYAGKLPEGAKSFTRNERDDTSFWKRLFSETGAEHVVRIPADSPFLDASIVNEMIDLHLKYLSEYTYSENLPQGFSCEIMGRELVESIPQSLEKMLPLGEVVRSNINQFDVELFYKEPDIRDTRISFRLSNPRDRRIMENIAEMTGDIPPYAKIRDILNSNPGVLFVGPSYVEIEITGRCELDCVFCHRTKLKNEHGDMDTALFRKICADLGAFSLPYSICLGGSGEPMMHDRFYEIMEIALSDRLCANLIVETNGIYAGANFKNFLLDRNDGRIKVIANINGLDGETYRLLHGKDYFDVVHQNICSLRDALPDTGSLYVQIMKINETEPFLDRYYDFWEKAKIPIVLQKQNTFCGLIEDRRYSDLSPLDRVPCWHLQRDLTVLADGAVAFCRQDADGVHARGNVKETSLRELWNDSLNAFLQDYKGDYRRNPDCASCDEWYTFNL